MASDELNKNGIPSLAYHAGLEDDERCYIQEQWVKDNCKVWGHGSMVVWGHGYIHVGVWGIISSPSFGLVIHGEV